MKLFAKIAVSVTMIVAALVYSPKPAKADMFGVTDVALLTQQILQYLQDMDIGDLSDSNFTELIQGIAKRAEGLKKMVNIFENGQQGIATFNNVVEVTKNLARTTKTINSYMTYIGTLGDDFEITKCYSVYRMFDSKTKLVFRQMERTLSSLKKLEGEDGSQLMTLMDKVISEANATLNTISHECISELSGEIYEYRMRKQGEMTNDFNNMIII